VEETLATIKTYKGSKQTQPNGDWRKEGVDIETDKAKMVKTQTNWTEKFVKSTDYWERCSLQVTADSEIEEFRNNKGYSRVLQRLFTSGKRQVKEERMTLNDGCGTKTEQTSDLINMLVTQKIDKLAENSIVWTEKSPTFSSVITHKYLTVDGETFCDEHVEKRGFDIEGNWHEVWGK